MDTDAKRSEAIDFLEAMEARHNQVLDELDALNGRIERVLDQYLAGRKSVSTVEPAVVKQAG